MAVTYNLKGTSNPYFKIGKSGSTLFQGTSDPSGSYTVANGDVWFDTSNGTLKFRSSGSVLKFDGFLKLYEALEDKQESNKILPEVKKNETLN